MHIALRFCSSLSTREEASTGYMQKHGNIRYIGKEADEEFTILV